MIIPYVFTFVCLELSIEFSFNFLHLCVIPPFSFLILHICILFLTLGRRKDSNSLLVHLKALDFGFFFSEYLFFNLLILMFIIISFFCFLSLSHDLFQTFRVEQLLHYFYYFLFINTKCSSLTTSCKHCFNHILRL